MSYLGKIVQWLLILLVFGCTDPTTNELSDQPEDSLITEQASDSLGALLSAKSQRRVSLDSTFNSLNLVELKARLGYMTSSYLSDESSAVYKRPDGLDGYLGKYYYPGPQIRREDPMLAGVVIFSNEDPWLYSNTNEILIEISCYDNNYVLSSLEIIGGDTDSLINIFENYERVSDQWHVYYDTGSLVKLIVSSTDSTGIAKSYRLGRYKEVSTDSITEFFKNTIW